MHDADVLVELEPENCRAVLSQHGIVLVKCWAASCGTCRELAPVYAKLADKHSQHTFATLDTMAEDELTSSLGIVHVPTLMLYRDGILLFKQAGGFDEARLEDIISQAEALDMDAVRADMEKDSAEGPNRRPTKPLSPGWRRL